MPVKESNEKFKDDQPLNTIHRARQILHSLGILTTEKWQRVGSSLYSVRVEIDGTQVGQNGKGTSEAYALASGYGEFMERLQLGTLYQAMELGPEALAAAGFYYAPDEEYLNAMAVLAAGGPVVEYLLQGGMGQENEEPATWLASQAIQWYPEAKGLEKEALLKEWVGETPPGCPADFVCLPYYSLKADRLFPIPVSMLRLPYLHNGAAAGNTAEEALVQAMSEILERYAHKKIMAGEVTPPVIPREYLEQYFGLTALIKQVEDQGFKVVFKDCSFNMGIPIVGAMLVDQKVGGYFVRFGVHPSFAVAAERCLTEAAQGRDLFGERREWLTRFQYRDGEARDPRNGHNVLRTGVGSYPRAFFTVTAEQFVGYPAVGDLSNGELLRRLTVILLNLSQDVLVRDVSYLGFAAYQVIVPGVSEVFAHDGGRLARERLRQQVRGIMKNLPAATTSELHKVVSFLIKRSGYVFETDCLGQLPGVPLQATFPWNQTPNFALIGAALYKMGKVHEAAGFFRQLAGQPAIKSSMDRQIYYRAVSDYLDARAADQDETEISSLLTSFYGRDVISTIVAEWRDPEKVLDRFGSLPCWNCQDCATQEWCSRKILLALHRKFKQRQVENPLDQMALRRFFLPQF